MINDQMLCAVSPVADGREGALAAAIKAHYARLEALLGGVGQVHFATLALLPKLPGDRGPVGLMFELVIDAEWQRADAVQALLAADAVALWAVYRFVQGAPAVDAPPLAWLNHHLCRQLRRTAAGFVGARDRSVTQIHTEAALLAQMQATPVTAAERAAPEALAQRVRAAARGQFPLSREPAPRSFWRRPGLRPMSRVLLIAAITVVPGLLLLSYLAALLVSVGELAQMLDAWLGYPSSQGLFRRAAWLSLETVAGLLLMPVVTALLLVAVRRGWLKTTAAVVGVLAFSVAALILFIKLGLEADRRELVADLLLSGMGLLLLADAALAVGVALLAALAFSPPARGPRALLLMAALPAVLLAVWLVFWPIPEGPRLAFWAALVWIGVAVLLGLVVRQLPHWRGQLAAWIARHDRLPASADAPSRPLQCQASLSKAEAKQRGHVSHMINLCELRVGPGGWLLVWLGQWLSLRLIGFLARVWFVNGKLGEIRDIHFAHWHLLPGRRLLFISNFDGNSVGYWDDFILGAAVGVNLVWRWTRLLSRSAVLPGHPAVTRDLQFPPTRLGIFLGCRREQHFKSYIRDGMVPPLFRFEAYALSLLDIERATLARDTVAAPPSPMTDQQLMRLLDA